MRTANKCMLGCLVLVFGFLVTGCGQPPPILDLRAVAYDQADGLVTVEIDVTGTVPSDATAYYEVTLQDPAEVISGSFGVSLRTISIRNLYPDQIIWVEVCVSGGSSDGEDCGEVELALTGNGNHGGSDGDGDDDGDDVNVVIIIGDGNTTSGDDNDNDGDDDDDDGDNDNDNNNPPPSECPSLNDLNFSGYRVSCVQIEDLGTQLMQSCEVVDSEGHNQFEHLDPCFKLTTSWVVSVPGLNEPEVHKQSHEDSLSANLPTPKGQESMISATIYVVAETANEQATILTTPAKIAP